MDRVTQEWASIGASKYLIFRFKGHLTDDVAKTAVAEWEDNFRNKLGADQHANIVWNCLEMSKYSTGAALSWKKALPKFSQQIGDIWLITTNPFFKMGAKTVTMLTSFELKVVSSHEEFTQKVSAVKAA